MHMFFAGIGKGGRPLGVEDRQEFIDTVRREVVFSAHVQRVVHLAPTPESIVVGISNESSGGWHETWRHHTFVCGYCIDGAGLARLDANLSLAEDASRIAGRFSVLIVDKLRGRLAFATQPARVDSVFSAENTQFLLFGNQASVISALRDGVVRYAPSQMSTFLNSGFFAYDDTPYEGVRCLSAFTTIQVANGRMTENKLDLSILGGGRENASTPRGADGGTGASGSPLISKEMLSDFLRGFTSLQGARCELGLTGGMDSRLVLAGATAAGADIECFTYAYGNRNCADVWVAQRLAELAHVRHHVLDAPRFMLDGTARFARLRETTLWTLVATDGMLACQYPVEPFFVFSPTVHLAGSGGEVLRGGYGERISRPTKDQVASHMEHLWNHSPHLFHPDLAAEQAKRIDAFVRAFPRSVSAGDMFDYLYVVNRCGRWTAAATSGSSSHIRPILDNVVVRHALQLPRKERRHHLVHRQLLRSLFPAANDLPLANKFWHGTPEAERDAQRRAWPQAFTEMRKPAGAKSALSFEEITAVKQYVVDSGRLSLFSDVLRVDEVSRYVDARPSDDRYYDGFLKSLFSAAVLLSEPWRDLRNADLERIPRLGVPRAS